MEEVLENIRLTPGAPEACRTLVQKGYRLALDDFQYGPAWEPLLDLGPIVKFDFRKTGLDERQEEVANLSRFKVKLLAEKAESEEEFNAAQKLGFDYFQGYFFRNRNYNTIKCNKFSVCYRNSAVAPAKF